MWLYKLCQYNCTITSSHYTYLKWLYNCTAIVGSFVSISVLLCIIIFVCLSAYLPVCLSLCLYYVILFVFLYPIISFRKICPLSSYHFPLFLLSLPPSLLVLCCCCCCFVCGGVCVIFPYRPISHECFLSFSQMCIIPLLSHLLSPLTLFSCISLCLVYVLSCITLPSDL